MFNSNIYYEVWSRKHDVNNKRQPLELIETFVRRDWQFAMKCAKRLRKDSREIIVREMLVNNVFRTIVDSCRGKKNG